MGALKSAKCSKGHRMRDPNLYYRKDGQRQCKKCKDLINKKQDLKRKKLSKVKRATLKQRIVARGGE